MTDKKDNKIELVIQNMMRSEDNRNYIYEHLSGCGVFDDIFNDNAIKHAYNAGKRASGLSLIEDLKQYAPENYIKMIQENI